MKRATAAGSVMSLQGLCERVQRWREHREGGRSRVPEELWNAAVGVARIEGVHATSKALRFNYYSLKERLDRADGAAVQEKKTEEVAAFVEVERSSLSSSASSRKMVVELVGRCGDRMRIDVADSSAVDVVGLAQTFWSREP